MIRVKELLMIILKKCHEFIDLYNSVTTRHLQHDEITLKAVYRELVLEKTKKK